MEFMELLEDYRKDGNLEGMTLTGTIAERQASAR
jgi:hypothetical protein